MAGWNPWHGCHKISAGCLNCYVYRIDARHGRDASKVVRNQDFDLPLRRTREGGWKIPPGETVYTCFSSDFFVEEADQWRTEAWEIMRRRPDLHFLMVTKRIHRFADCIPPDWGGGYENVTICCTVENQAMADTRLPVYLAAPIRHRALACEPLLEPVDLENCLRSGAIERLVCGGESGENARPCDYDWILSLRAQCLRSGVDFYFKQTGANFIRDGRQYRVPRRLQRAQARAAGIDCLRRRPDAIWGRGPEEEQITLDLWEER